MNEESIIVSHCIFLMVAIINTRIVTKLASCHVFELISNLVLNR